MRIAIAGAAVLALAVVGLGLAHGDAPPALDAQLAASGILRMSNSHNGEAILVAENLKPGSRAKGRVYVRDTGTMPGHFTLHPVHLVDEPGPNGGLLSQVLNLRIRSWSKSRRVYSGPLATTPVIDLGEVRPNRGRVVVFKIHFPRMAPALANPYNGSRASVEYVWKAG